MDDLKTHMKWYDPKVLIKLGGLSILSFIILLGLTTLMAERIGWREGDAYSLALVVVLVVNFSVMRYGIYRVGGGGAARQAAGFLLVSVVSRSLERLSFELLVGGLGMQYQMAVILISCVFTLLKYAVYGKWIFKTRPPSAPAG